MNSTLITRVLIMLTFALQLAWQLWSAPPLSIPAWLAATLMGLPILPAVIMVLTRSAQAGFWGGLAALFYFCHGITELYAAPAVRGLAIIQTVLACGLVFAVGWNGVRARFARKSDAPV